MTPRTPRRGVQAARHVRRPGAGAPDATTEPDPGPPPEAVFDRLTGPYGRRFPPATPGAIDLDEGT